MSFMGGYQNNIEGCQKSRRNSDKMERMGNFSKGKQSKKLIYKKDSDNHVFSP